MSPSWTGTFKKKFLDICLVWTKNIACHISKQMMLGPTSLQSLQPPPTMHTERIQDGEIQNTGPRWLRYM